MSTSFASTKPMVRLISTHDYQVTAMRKKFQRTYCMCSEQDPTAELACSKTMKYIIDHGHAQNTDSQMYDTT